MRNSGKEAWGSGGAEDQGAKEWMGDPHQVCSGSHNPHLSTTRVP